MGILNALKSFADTVTKFSTEVSNIAKGTKQTAGDPANWAEKLSDIGKVREGGMGRNILKEFIETQIVDRIKPKKTKPGFTEERISLGDLVEKEVVVEIVCIDKQTGTASTYTILIKYSQLSSVLANPQKAIQDAGDEGCSGTPGTDVDIIASVQN